MSYTLQQVVDIACERSGAPDAEARAEALLEQACGEAADYFASDVTRAGAVTETKSVALVSGSATLDGDVYLARIEQGRLYDPADLSKRYVFLRRWEDFTDPAKDARQGYWTVVGQALYSIEPAAAYEEGAGATQAMKLSCVTSPEVPATDSTAWTEPDEVVEMVIESLAGMLRPKEAT
jgi:hypothetical protein